MKSWNMQSLQNYSDYSGFSMFPVFIILKNEPKNTEKTEMYGKSSINPKFPLNF